MYVLGTRLLHLPGSSAGPQPLTSQHPPQRNPAPGCPRRKYLGTGICPSKQPGVCRGRTVPAACARGWFASNPTQQLRSHHQRSGYRAWAEGWAPAALHGPRAHTSEGWHEACSHGIVVGSRILPPAFSVPGKSWSLAKSPQGTSELCHRKAFCLQHVTWGGG